MYIYCQIGSVTKLCNRFPAAKGAIEELDSQPVRSRRVIALGLQLQGTIQSNYPISAAMR